LVGRELSRADRLRILGQKQRIGEQWQCR
jgi:hypothetical protein